MHKRSSNPDINEIAASIVSQLGGEPIGSKNPAAVALGRMGGLKGGPARAKRLSRTARRRIARKAAKARWKAKRKAS